AKFCCDCCQINVVVLPAVGKSGTVTSLLTPVRNSPTGMVTVNCVGVPCACPLTKSCAECEPGLKVLKLNNRPKPVLVLPAPHTLAVSARADPYGAPRGVAPSMAMPMVGPWQAHPESKPMPLWKLAGCGFSSATLTGVGPAVMLPDCPAKLVGELTMTLPLRLMECVP